MLLRVPEGPNLSNRPLLGDPALAELLPPSWAGSQKSDLRPTLAAPGGDLELPASGQRPLGAVLWRGARQETPLESVLSSLTSG